MTKRKQTSVLADVEKNAEVIADMLAKQRVSDVDRAMKAIREVTASGDVNGTRLQGAQLLLRVAGVLDQASTKTTVKADTAADGKITVEVVHVEKPHAEDD